MKLVGLMPVRNEAWVLAMSARVALMWCDEIVIGLHACTDASPDIAMDLMKEYPGRVVVCSHPEAIWDEMTQRQRLLGAARQRMATHIAMIDADEILTGNLLPAVQRLELRAETSEIDYGGESLYTGIREKMERLGDRMLTLPIYNLRGGIHRYHANGLWGNRTVSLAFKDDPQLHWGGDTFHRREPQGKRLQSFCPIAHGEGGVMHLWGASERRLIAKHAMYKVTERLRWPDKDVRDIDFMYSQCVKGGLRENPKDWTFADVPEAWWKPYEHLLRYLDVDAEPWQEAEVRRLVAEHGREKFAGLDLFGVA